MTQQRERGLSFADKSDRPGDMVISRTVCNYAPQGGRLEYQPLEEFISQQDEEAAAEQGQKPKAGLPHHWQQNPAQA